MKKAKKHLASISQNQNWKTPKVLTVCKIVTPRKNTEADLTRESHKSDYCKACIAWAKFPKREQKYHQKPILCSVLAENDLKTGHAKTTNP